MAYGGIEVLSYLTRLRLPSGFTCTSRIIPDAFEVGAMLSDVELKQESVLLTGNSREAACRLFSVENRQNKLIE